MADAQAEPFTDEEVRTQASGNATVFALALLTQARERGQRPEEVARWFGQTVAPGWDEIDREDARTAMRWVALNVVSLGGELRSLSGHERRAEATVAGWPAAEFLALFGLSQAEADALTESFEPIGERLGLRFSWQRQADAITMMFTQAEEA